MLNEDKIDDSILYKLLTMPDNTPNHDLNLYEQGDEDWTHTPDMETIEERLIVRDLGENRDDYTPYADALFFARDSKTWYVGDGTSWTRLGTIGESTIADGIDDKRDHIGAFHSGGYHDGVFDSDPRFALRFAAKNNLTIHSFVVDTDLSSVSVSEMPIELRRYHAEGDTDLLDTHTAQLDGGPQRINVNFTIPDEAHEEYCITRGPTNEGTASEEIVPCRRIKSWGGWEDYSDFSGQGIDLIGSTHAVATGNDVESLGNYYYAFDMEVGDRTTRITSPWSHDVEEIYMRPRDPTEEYDNVSPRALWIDTS